MAENSAGGAYIDLKINGEKFKSEVNNIGESAAKDLSKKLANINLGDLQKQLREAKEQLNEAIQLGNTNAEVKIRGDIEDLKVKIKEGQKSLKELEESGNKVSDSLSSKFANIGNSIKSFFAIGVVALGVSKLKELASTATDTAISFESAFAGVKKTINATEAEFKALKREILNLKIPMTFEELSKIAEIGGQLGVGLKDITKFTDTVARIAVSTNVTAEKAATDFARIASITGEPLQNIDKMASSVVGLGNNFAAQENEILSFSERIAGAGKIVGLTTGSIFGISTAFTAVGMQAEAGGTAVNNALIAMNKAVLSGGAELERFASVAGVTSSKFAELWNNNSSEAFRLFITGLGKSGDEAIGILENLLGTDANLTRGFLSLANAGDLLTRAINRGNTEFKNNTALHKESEERFNTTENKLKSLNNEMRKQEEQLGLKLIPLLIKWKQLQGDIADFFVETEDEEVVKLRNLRAFTKELIDNSDKIKQNGGLTADQKDKLLELTITNNKLALSVMSTKQWFASQGSETKRLTTFMEELRKENETATSRLKELGVSLQDNNSIGGLFSNTISIMSQRLAGVMPTASLAIKGLQGLITTMKSSGIQGIFDGAMNKFQLFTSKMETARQLQQKYNDLSSTNPQLVEIMKVEKSLDGVNKRLTEAKANGDKLGELSARVEYEKLNTQLSKLNKQYDVTTGGTSGKTLQEKDIGKVEKYYEVLLQKARGNDQEVIRLNEEKEAKILQIKMKYGTASDDIVKEAEERDKKIKEEEKKAQQKAIDDTNEYYNKLIIAAEGNNVEVLRLEKERNSKILALKGKTSDEIVKQAEEDNKQIASNYKEINKALDDSSQEITKYVAKIGDIKDKWTEMKYSAKKDMAEISNSIKELNKEEEKDKKDFNEKLAQRRLEIPKDIKDLQDQVKELEKSGITQSVAQDIYNSIGKDTLKQIGEDSYIGGTKISDIFKIIELSEKIDKLNKEKLTNQKSLSEETFKELEIKLKMSETDKILADQKKKEEEVEKERKGLKEKLAIAEAESKGKKIMINQQGEDLKAYYEDEKGQMIEIKDFKNIQYAQDFEDKRTKLANEYLEVQKSLQSEREEYNALFKAKSNYETLFTDILKVEIEKQKGFVENLIEVYKRLNQVKNGGTDETIQTTMTTSSPAPTVSGKRAYGGSVQAGQTYWVGENFRPEQFVPKQSGTIMPTTNSYDNSKKITIDIRNINSQNGVDFAEWLQRNIGNYL